MTSKINIDTNAFIEAYRREACPWNVFNEEYKNQVTKTDAQKRLAEEFDITGKVRTIAVMSCMLFFLVKLSSKIDTNINTLILKKL